MLKGLGWVAAGFGYGLALCGAAERWPMQMAAAVHWIRAAQLVEVLLAGCAFGFAVLAVLVALVALVSGDGEGDKLGERDE